MGLIKVLRLLRLPNLGRQRVANPCALAGWHFPKPATAQAVITPFRIPAIRAGPFLEDNPRSGIRVAVGSSWPRQSPRKALEFYAMLAYLGPRDELRW